MKTTLRVTKVTADTPCPPLKRNESEKVHSSTLGLQGCHSWKDPVIGMDPLLGQHCLLYATLGRGRVNPETVSSLSDDGLGTFKHGLGHLPVSLELDSDDLGDSLVFLTTATRFQGLS